jgi:hypothetical protein
MAFVAWFQLVLGVGIAGLWTVLLATRQVPELTDGSRAIRFHLAVEYLTAVLLVAGGLALLLVGGSTAAVLSGVALGALLYSAINSPGYYADQGRRDMVVFFGVVVAATVGAVAVLLGRS